MSKDNKVLVTYASRAGSTAGIAEAIAISLAENGVQAELHPMQEVQDLSPYSAVVAGSAIHGGKWLPEAMRFVNIHKAALADKPVAIFMVCITLSMADAEKYRSGLRDWLAPVCALVTPVSEGYFAGQLDFSKLPFTFNTLLMRLPVLFGLWQKGDHRDWDAVGAWAQDIRPLLLKSRS